MGKGNGGSTTPVHIGTNNAESDKEGTTAIVGIVPVFGNRIQGYRKSKRMAVNGMVEQLCKEDEVGYVDLWDSFVRREEMYVRDDLHLKPGVHTRNYQELQRL